jgi:hypothetical protein
MAIPINRTVEEAPAAGGGLTDLTRLHATLIEQIGEAVNSDEAIRRLLRATRELTNAAAVAYFRESPGPTSPPVQADCSEGCPFDASVALSRMSVNLRRVFEEQRIQIASVDHELELRAILVPVIHMDGTTHVLAAVLVIGEEPLESFVVILQLIAGYLTLFSQRIWNSQTDWEARGAAAILELTSRILASPSLRAASFDIANEVRQFLGVREVAVGRRQRRSCRLEAVSGLADLSLTSELAGQYAAVLEESFLKQDATTWSVDAARPTTEAHRQLCVSRRARCVFSSPLIPVDGEACWGWVILADEPLEPQALRWLHAAGPHLAVSMSAVTERRRGLRGHGTSRRAWWILAGILIVCLFLPTPFPITGDCVAQPMTRRFVAAPFDGTLISSSVRPGDLVAADQVLARLDDRDLRSQLTEAIAQRASAETRATASLARKEVTDAQLARLEAERMALRIALYQRHLDEIEMTSPFDGIVLSGDWNQAMGMPLRVGQTLFEIAPLDRMRIEVDIAEEDIPWVAEGATVDLWFDAISQSDRGRIERIHPRSEVRGGNNIFVAEIHLANEHDLLRPGLRGTVRIRAGTRPLGWILFRKPWYLLRRVLWW